MKILKRIVFTIALALSIILLVGCGKQAQASDDGTITVGSHTSDLEV